MVVTARTRERRRLADPARSARPRMPPPELDGRSLVPEILAARARRAVARRRAAPRSSHLDQTWGRAQRGAPAHRRGRGGRRFRYVRVTNDGGRTASSSSSTPRRRSRASCRDRARRGSGDARAAAQRRRRLPRENADLGRGADARDRRARAEPAARARLRRCRDPATPDDAAQNVDAQGDRRRCAARPGSGWWWSSAEGARVERDRSCRPRSVSVAHPAGELDAAVRRPVAERGSCAASTRSCAIVFSGRKMEVLDVRACPSPPWRRSRCRRSTRRRSAPSGVP